MTLPDERSRSIRYAREFLRSLLDPKKTPKVPTAVRRGASNVLRHFPADYHINEVADLAPEVFDKLEDKQDE